MNCIENCIEFETSFIQVPLLATLNVPETEHENDQLCHTRWSPCLQLKAPSSQNVPPRLGISSKISLPFQVFEVVTSHVLFTHSFLPRQILTCCSYVGLEISEYHDLFLQKCVLMRIFILLGLIILIRFTTYLWFQKIKHHQSRKKKNLIQTLFKANCHFL